MILALGRTVKTTITLGQRKNARRPPPGVPLLGKSWCLVGVVKLPGRATQYLRPAK